MGRWIGLATLLCGSSAFGEPADVASTDAPGVPVANEEPPTQAIGYAALPGGIHVPMAQPLPAGVVELGLVGGFGYRKGLLSKDHTLKRGIGDLAAAYGVTDQLSVSISLDGRVDKHTPTDDG
ncbi:MAG: hypothetical protein NT062_18815, partial [Proteobacteria bacterium]|nr:hypothetical protein [Pseudomonadota bacterium]